MKYSLKIVKNNNTVPTQVVTGAELQEVVRKAEEFAADESVIGVYVQKENS